MNPLLGEFLGTLVLVLIGNGTVANVVLKKTLGNGSGWAVIISGFAFGVMAGIFTAQATGSPGAHINPAVTLALAVNGAFPWADVPGFFLAQLLGGLAGAVLVWVHFLPHWGETPDAGGKLACFSTGPAIKNTVANFISEALGTFVLVFGIVCIVKGAPAAGLAQLEIGLLVWGVGASLGGTTGFAINPARDLGPRIAHAILPIPGKGGSDFGYGIAVPVLGGFAGAVAAGILLKVLGL